jgi:hypothetical protein
MGRLLAAASFLVAALGARHVYTFMNRHGKARSLQRRLELWEGEGGAVPVSRRRTAAQVSPLRESPHADR